MLAERVTFKGEEMPLRNAQAKLAVLPEYADREALGEIQAAASASFNPDRLELIAAGEALSADLSGIADPVERNEEEKDISLRELSEVLKRTSDAAADAFAQQRERWFERLLGHERADVPSSYHTAYMRRLSPLESTYTKERATEICLQTLTELGFDLAAATNIKLDLDDRPQKAPRACVIASDPPSVVHLITRAQGGLHDYQAFLHEAGHALHYGGVRPVAAVHVPPHLARPRADRDLLVHRRGDLPRAGLAREVLRPLRRAGAPRTPRRRRSSRRCSSAATRRSSATSSASGRASPRTAARPRATRSTSPPRPASATAADGYLSDMDAGFYSADYLRAWIRSAQLRRHLIDTVGEDWWRNPATGRAPRASSSPRARSRRARRSPSRIGFDPLDTAPLLDEIGA